MSKLYLLFNHTLYKEQQEDAYNFLSIDEIIYLPDALLSLWRDIDPQSSTLDDKLQPIYDFFARECQVGDCVLIQGDMGATYLAVKKAFDLGLVPVYATTKRDVVEKYENGEVVKEVIFRHERFRRYGE